MDAPHTPEFFFGNEQAKQILAAVSGGGRAAHAFLVTGERGLGKRTYSRLLAAALLCKAKIRPCMSCTSCHKALADSHPDVSLIAGEGARSFHIDAVRELRRKAQVRPNEADAKVFILANCESMTAQAQNALLKLLEEPPENTYFILTASGRAELLETVYSRVMEIRLSPLSEAECARVLRARYPETGEEGCNQAARLSGGNLGRALELLGGGHQVMELARAVLFSISQGAYYTLLAFAPAQGDRTLLVQVFDRLILLFRDVLTQKLGGETSLSGEAIPDEVIRCFTRTRAMAAIDAAQGAKRALLQNAGPQLILSWFVAGLCA